MSKKKDVQEVPAAVSVELPSVQDDTLAQEAVSNSELPETPSEEVRQGDSADKPANSLVEAASEVIKAFLAWASSSEPLDDLAPFVSAGLLTEDHALTDEGVSLLDSEGVAWRTINFLTLGVPVTYRFDGKPITIKEGSMLRILNGGYDDSLASKFWRCDAGEKLPETVIYQHRLHTFSEARYPLLQPLDTSYGN